MVAISWSSRSLTVVRIAPARLLIACLLMMAMGWAQLLGVGRGYWCECTEVPKRVAGANCAADVCHPLSGHAHSDHGSPLPAACDSVDGDAHSGCPDAPDHPRHQEAREPLVSTAAGTVISLPMPLIFDLPPTVVGSWFSEMVVSMRGRGRLGDWLHDGNPPMPVLVARTMVMRV